MAQGICALGTEIIATQTGVRRTDDGKFDLMSFVDIVKQNSTTFLQFFKFEKKNPQQNKQTTYPPPKKKEKTKKTKTKTKQNTMGRKIQQEQFERLGCNL